MKLIWLILGLLSIGAALIGVVLPLLPTVPFLLLAAFFFARSSERLHNWLISHPKLGPPILDWERNGAIAPTAKRLATVSVVAVFALSVLMGLRPMLLGIQAVTLSCVLLFLWTRPN
ncbi:YbaN family protein [Lentibacter sp. XHP0401]|uniref:YbaN family protein n=1 Tax=Lentibacter sp. XHP0401 TaxID=2984334 RepID=UPI0021E981DE|nr:YbaN family protein [Lentibacter sp. XHP0401]MCV2892591.1 YbaN family protein [Lentibacter sp. XHP0401]